MLGIRLDDPVGKLIASAPAAVAPLTTLRGAASMLTSNWVGALLVTGAEGPAGIITERDLVHAIDDGVDTGDERVRSYMSEELETVHVDTSVREAGEVMLRDEIRHLVVVDDTGAAVGVVSMRDVLAAALDTASPTLLD